ncbi:hypothetical protein VQY72_002140 [Salmonella enterica]|nr:hypothetical protein [Salmonella enterica]
MKDISEYSDSDLESIIIINKIYRKCLLKKSIGMMDEIGLRWKNSLSETDHAELKKLKVPQIIVDEILANIRPRDKSLFEIAESNYYRTIGKVIYNLSPAERVFYDNALSLPFYCTHATSVRNVETHNPKLIKENTAKLKLNSWYTLKQKGLGMRNKFIPQRNISSAVIGNDDFIFFSLEVGSSLKKCSSRFGRRMYRVPIESNLAFRYSLITLNNLLTHKNNPVKLSMPDVIPDIRRLKFKYNPIDIIAVGEIKKFVICSLIKTFRSLPMSQQDLLLSYRDDYHINILINSFFRPQICVPHRFYSRTGEYEVHELLE